MAHHEEPMDVDCMDSEFDNKENTYHHSNVLPCTEKGYEELDVSELNMKLRYSVTPVSSPMSKSFTAHVDNKNLDNIDSLNNEYNNLTRSLNSTMTNNDSVIKSLKSLPLQALPAEKFTDGNGNPSLTRQLESTISDNTNDTVTVSGTHDIDETISLPSSSSSALHTPATTPTKEIMKNDEVSPIMRGLKSVLNMFRTSQSPIPPAEDETSKQHVLSPPDAPICESAKLQAKASTPIATHRTKDGNTSRRSSPLKDSIVFNDDLEKELSWKDETTIFFSGEKIPVHKLFLQHTKPVTTGDRLAATIEKEVKNPCFENKSINTTLEYMDISHNESMVENRTMTDVTMAGDSDSEFVDCETTLNKTESEHIDNNITLDGGNTNDVLETIDAQKPNLAGNILTGNASMPKNNQVVQLDVTSISFIDGDCINYVPSDNSDYSKETSEILSELENMEACISSKANISDFNKVQENKHERTEISQVLAINDCINDVQNIVQAEKPLSDNDCLKESEILPSENITVINDKLPEIAAAPETEKPADVPLPDEDDNEILDEILIDTMLNNVLSVVQDLPATPTYLDIANDHNLLNNVTEEILSNDAILPENANTQAVVTSEIATIEPILSVTEVPHETTQENVSENENVNNTGSPEANNIMPVDLASQSEAVEIETVVEHANVSKISLTSSTKKIFKNVVPHETAQENVSENEIVNNTGSPEINNTMPVNPACQSEAIEITTVLDQGEVPEIILTSSTKTILENVVPHESTEENVSENEIANNTGSTETNNFMPVVLACQSETVEITAVVEHGEVPEINLTSSTKTILKNVVPYESTQENISENEIVHNTGLPDTNNIVPVDLACQSDAVEVTAVIEHGEVPEINLTSSTKTILENVVPYESTQENISENEIVNNTGLPETNNIVPVDLACQSDAVEVTAVVEQAVAPETILTSPTKTILENVSDSNTTNVVDFPEVVSTCQSSPAFDQNYECNKTQDINNYLNAINVTITNTNSEYIQTTVVEQAEVPEIILTSSTKTILENVSNSNNTNNVGLPEVVSTCNSSPAFDQSYECNKTQDVNNPVNELNITITKTNSEYIQTHEKNNVEPMDITMNETHDLPDLINQTITMIEDNLENTKKTCETVSMPQVTTEIHKSIIETPSVIKEGNTEHIKGIVPEILNTTVDQQNTELEEQDCLVLNTDLSVMKENVTQLDSEKSLTDNAAMNVAKDDVMPPEIVMIDQNVNNTVEAAVVDEEIIVSGNNSPYVSLMTGLDAAPEKEQHFEEIVTTFNTTTNIPSSPPIRSRGYNFNFDEMDDPFATNTKVSPLLDTLFEPIEPAAEQKIIEVPKRFVANRRKFQPIDKKNPFAMKKKINATFDTKLAPKISISDDKIQDIKDNNESDTDIISESSQNKKAKPVTIKSPSLLKQFDRNNTTVVLSKSEETDENIIQKLEKSLESSEENKTSIESITSVSNDAKAISSSEQSTYYSAGTSSTDSYKSKNVFNLPEIEDMNFNPFATKSKTRQSPPRDLELKNPFATRTKILNSPDASIIIAPQEDLNSMENVDSAIKLQHIEKINTADKMETELMEKETSANISSITTSSKATDNQNVTAREINTEDEDTEEGPFLEADDGIDKMLDFDDGNVDMIQLDELPAQSSDNNDGELFIDAEAFEFLLNQNKSNVVADSGKESLFLKFDPLFAKRISSGGVLAALSKVQKKQSTPTKPARPSLKNEASPIAGPSTLNITYEGDHNVSQESNEDQNITVSKPMMVVTPAVNPVVTPRNKSITPTRSNRRSITFTSPAIAVIDRLLSMSSNNSFMGQDTTITHPNREQNEADLALMQLRELLAEKEINVYNLRSESKELIDRLATMESQVKILEADGQERLKKINELNERLAEKTKINKSMAVIVEEYERTIASLIAETEQDKKRNAEERIRLINERDEQSAHLASMEVSFSDLHSKYEKSKQVILACKANEDTYKKSIQDFEENLNKMQTNYELLKQHATSKLNHANQELEKINRSNEAEIVKLNAMIKRKELHITSLEETLTQKTKANEELAAICDELINKVGN